MQAIAYIVLLAWLPLSMLFWGIMPPRRALLFGLLGGWLMLPVATMQLPGIPDYGKIAATSVGPLLGALLFHSRPLLALRPRWFDLPMVVWCLCPIATSLSNQLGLYDGLSTSLRQMFAWGIPYMLGRAYFSSLPAMRDLAIGGIVGAIVYVPLCMYELQMSPQLHSMIYGMRQHVWMQTHRFGGWRPMVFLEHGLAVGMFMCSAAMIALWLLHSRAISRIAGLPMTLICPVLFVIAVLCKSVLAVLLLIAGAGTLWASKELRLRLLLITMLAFPPFYIWARTTERWQGQEMLTVAKLINPERLQSLETRLNSEKILVDHALTRPWLGWGGWQRNLVLKPNGRYMGIPDGLWINALGKFGIVGVTALAAALLMAPLLFLFRFHPRQWSQPAIAPAAALAMVVMLHMIDNLLNAMHNPYFVLAAGAVAGLLPAARTVRQPSPRRLRIATSRPTAPAAVTDAVPPEPQL